MDMSLDAWYRQSRMTWFAILAGMLSLFALTVVFHYLQIFKEPVAQDPAAVSNIFLLIVFGFAFLIIILKRMFFNPAKLVDGAKHKSRTAFQENDEEARRKQLAMVLSEIRKYRILIWIMADMIIIVGFLSYVFLLSFQTFLIYSVVGIYSLVINFPAKSLHETCVARISEQ